MAGKRAEQHGNSEKTGAERSEDEGITGLMLLLTLHWDQPSFGSAGPGFPPLANTWSPLGRDSGDMGLAG